MNIIIRILHFYLGLSSENYLPQYRFLYFNGKNDQFKLPLCEGSKIASGCLGTP